MLHYVIDFIILYTIIYLIYVIIINRKRKKYEELKNTSEVKIIIKRYNLDMKKIKYKKLLNMVALINSFIISFTSVIILNIESIVYRILIGFIVVILLTYSLYELLGLYYKKRNMTSEDK